MPWSQALPRSVSSTCWLRGPSFSTPSRLSKDGRSGYSAAGSPSRVRWCTLSKACRTKKVMARLRLEGTHPEGRFFPETYHFPAGATDVQLLRRAFDAMSSYLQSAWTRRDEGLPLSSPDEMLVLASIVEKETGVSEERARIAGVFVSRLRRGMRLETDPTVIYGLGSEFDGNLRKTDLRRDTPYNTYMRKGLPPTPIAIPSAAAIDAVMAPLEDGSLYFVSKGDGRHVFSSNYDDHRKAVRRYQIRARRNERSAQTEGE